MFGGQHKHVDPKVGLGLYGPYSLVGQNKPPLSSITVGIIGSAAMVGDAEQWLKKCANMILNDGSEPFQRPHFPGINSDHPFCCELKYGDTWREIIREQEIKSAISGVNFYERIKQIVHLYIQKIEILSERDPKPDAIICCIPQEVIDVCTVRITKSGEIKRRKISKSEKRAIKIIRTGQQYLFPEMNPSIDIEEEEPGHHNLRRGLKAEAMQYGIPTQIVWPRTLTEIKSDESSQQDAATRAWNFITALYHKAGGSPWRLAEIEPGTCFVGISFYRELSDKSPHLRTSMAQAFTAAGDGYVLRGNTFEWNESEHGKSPHLDAKMASTLMSDVLSLYQRQNRGCYPSRVVVHKTSRFWEEELTGFEEACQIIPRTDFVALGQRGIQFYRLGDYPPLRGTYVKLDDSDLILYTTGYIPYLKTYPGARVPRPLEIIEHHGDSPWNVILAEIMALTKMNWNTANFACSDPVTIAFSKRVGQILAELPPNLSLRPEYRFYM